jgi:DNA repair exonuclease SbcCD ATPase subunit
VEDKATFDDQQEKFTQYLKENFSHKPGFACVQADNIIAEFKAERDALLAEQLEWSKQKWNDEKRIKQLEAEREELRKRVEKLRDLNNKAKDVLERTLDCEASASVARNRLEIKVQELESDLRNEMNANIQLDMDKREIINTIRGLSHGVDWNNGTHAKEYRPRLLALLEKYGNEQRQDK